MVVVGRWDESYSESAEWYLTLRVGKKREGGDAV